MIIRTPCSLDVGAFGSVQTAQMLFFVVLQNKLFFFWISTIYHTWPNINYTFKENIPQIPRCLGNFQKSLLDFREILSSRKISHPQILQEIWGIHQVPRYWDSPNVCIFRKPPKYPDIWKISFNWKINHPSLRNLGNSSDS